VLLTTIRRLGKSYPSGVLRRVAFLLVVPLLGYVKWRFKKILISL